MPQTPSQNALAAHLGQTGQVASFEGLEKQVELFEQILKMHGVAIKPGSDLESACLSVVDTVSKNRNPEFINALEDVRPRFTEILGIWSFLTKIVRLHNHRTFRQFVPHLELLNEGPVIQNNRLRISDEASNKIFELLFALILLDVGTDIILDHPSLAEGDNPDILATIDGYRWGFACKTVYGKSGKTFFGNLKKGCEQIECSEALLGCVVVNFRNLLDHDAFLPIMNSIEYQNGAEPEFGAYLDPSVIIERIKWMVLEKQNQVFDEIGRENVLNTFAGRKAIPGFLAFCQTRASKITYAGPVATAISSLMLANFDNSEDHLAVFSKINEALHERP